MNFVRGLFVSCWYCKCNDYIAIKKTMRLYFITTNWRLRQQILKNVFSCFVPILKPVIFILYVRDKVICVFVKIVGRVQSSASNNIWTQMERTCPGPQVDPILRFMALLDPIRVHHTIWDYRYCQPLYIPSSHTRQYISIWHLCTLYFMTHGEFLDS